MKFKIPKAIRRYFVIFTIIFHIFIFSRIIYFYFEHKDAIEQSITEKKTK